MNTTQLREQLETTYGHTLRVRAMGLLRREGRWLLLRHRGVGLLGELWLPPGGGVQLGEPLAQAIRREFDEECGLDVEVGKLLYTGEYVEVPLHAIEFIFSVEAVHTNITLGTDPEWGTVTEPLFDQWRWFSEAELQAVDPRKLHPYLVKLAQSGLQSIPYTHFTHEYAHKV